METEGGVSARGAFPTQGDDWGDANRQGSSLMQEHAVLAGDTATGKQADAARSIITLTMDEAITRPSRLPAGTGRRRKAQGVELSTERSTHTGALFEPAQLRGIDQTVVATAEDRS